MDISKISKIVIFTPEGTTEFTIKELNTAEGYGYNKVSKVLSRIFEKNGILKIRDKKIDLTRQLVQPLIVEKD